MKQLELFSSNKDLRVVIAPVYIKMFVPGLLLRAQSTCITITGHCSSHTLVCSRWLGEFGFGFDCASRHLEADQRHREETLCPQLLGTSYMDKNGKETACPAGRRQCCFSCTCNDKEEHGYTRAGLGPALRGPESRDMTAPCVMMVNYLCAPAEQKFHLAVPKVGKARCQSSSMCLN